MHKEGNPNHSPRSLVKVVGSVSIKLNTEALVLVIFILIVLDFKPGGKFFKIYFIGCISF